MTETKERPIVLDVPLETTLPTHLRHLITLATVLRKDYDTLLIKETEYEASWMKRGGVGAFRLAQLFDRRRHLDRAVVCLLGTRAFNHLFELTHVVRPRISQQAHHRPVMKRSVGKVRRQMGDVLNALA